MVLNQCGREKRLLLELFEWIVYRHDLAIKLMAKLAQVELDPKIVLVENVKF